jgi:hypothetical protein
MFVCVSVLNVFRVLAVQGTEIEPPRLQLHLQPDPIYLGPDSASFVLIDRDVGFADDRILLEVDGAREHAADWLHRGGFSMLEEKDGHGRKSYVMMSDSFARRLPTMRVRARIGRPQLSAGLRQSDRSPAFGVTVPWQRYTFELEGLNDRRLGYAFVGSARWSQEDQRLQYGIAVPMALSRGPSVGVILQLGVRFGK